MKRTSARWNELAARYSQVALWSTFVKWTLLGGMAGLLAGSASALFLASLNWVTRVRLEHAWLLFLLPLGGALVSGLYMRYGRNSAKGNNLILEQIQQDTEGTEAIPLRMAPLVLGGTLITHLFGGSAGREGTAVQMGGSLADALGRWLRITPPSRTILLMCGISGGFGSIFGTPLAGTVFGLEVIAIGLISHKALLPCFTASFVGDLTASHVWGVRHIHYQVDLIPPLDALVLVKVIFASILFGLVSLLFSRLTHYLKRRFTARIAHPMLKSFTGGVIIIALVYIAGSRDYLGLGIPLISSSFESEVPPFAFLWKLIFTAFTLGTGFQGGEVTPLFAIGATMGNSLAGLLHLYGPFLASLGFIAVFCGAVNTPLACFIMGIELFGSAGAVYMFIACVISYLFSGHSGIYSSQLIGISKSALLPVPEGTRLEDARKYR